SEPEPRPVSLEGRNLSGRARFVPEAPLARAARAAARVEATRRWTRAHSSARPAQAVRASLLAGIAAHWVTMRLSSRSMPLPSAMSLSERLSWPTNRGAWVRTDSATAHVAAKASAPGYSSPGDRDRPRMRRDAAPAPMARRALLTWLPPSGVYTELTAAMTCWSSAGAAARSKVTSEV